MVERIELYVLSEFEAIEKKLTDTHDVYQIPLTNIRIYYPKNKGIMIWDEEIEECYFCKKRYTVKHQKEAGVVFCPNDTGRIACKSCWDKFAGQLKELLKYLKVDDIIRVLEE